MLDRFLEELSSVSAAGHLDATDQVWAITAAFFAGHGFDKLIHLYVAPGQFSLQTTMPDAWIARYQERGYAGIDPFLSHCCDTFRPISTGIAYADQHRGLSAAQMNLIEEASYFGWTAGFSSTMRLRDAQGLAGWNIGSSLSRKDVDALRADREAELRLAAHHAHLALARAKSAPAVLLSPRENQCLWLLAQGCRTKDIAHELGLSTSAVELYLRNARQKLGAATREQAVAMFSSRMA
jgi:DNA-binding CsgD family transcriptional regulator